MSSGGGCGEKEYSRKIPIRKAKKRKIPILVVGTKNPMMGRILHDLPIRDLERVLEFAKEIRSRRPAVREDF